MKPDLGKFIRFEEVETPEHAIKFQPKRLAILRDNITRAEIAAHYNHLNLEWPYSQMEAEDTHAKLVKAKKLHSRALEQGPVINRKLIMFDGRLNLNLPPRVVTQEEKDEFNAKQQATMPTSQELFMRRMIRRKFFKRRR